jgi:hypothetical protein
MKSRLLLFISTILMLSCFSQQRDFTISFHEKNTFKPNIDSIGFEAFVKIRKTGIRSGPLTQSIYFSDEQNREADSTWKTIDLNKRQQDLHMDSLVRILKKNYAKAFFEKDSCLIINGIDNKIVICNNRNRKDDLSWTSFKYLDYQKGYLIIQKEGNERWEYILFNPRTRNYKYFEHPPCFLNDSIVYCSANYYGEGGFQIMQLTGKSYFGFETYNWVLEECYRIDKVFYFSFRSNFRPNMTPKYFCIDVSKYF